MRKYIADGREELQPSKSVMFGKIEIYLYTKEDIERMRAALTSPVRDYVPTGRPTKYTLEQRKKRQRLFSKRYYYKTQKEKYEFLEQDDKAVRSQDQIDKIQGEIEGMNEDG